MKTFCFLTLLLFFITVQSQDKNKLRYEGFSFSFPTVFFTKDIGGLAINADIDFRYSEHYFKFFAQTGSEIYIEVFGPSRKITFYEANVLYGRVLKLSNRFFISGFWGIGLFNKTETIPERIPGSGSSCGFGGFCFPSNGEYEKRKERNTGIGFPLQAKLLYRLNKRFSMGLLFHANLNSKMRIHAIGLNFQWIK